MPPTATPSLVEKYLPQKSRRCLPYEHEYYGIISAGLTKVGKKATKEGKRKKERRKKREKKRKRTEREGRFPTQKTEETPGIIKGSGKRGSIYLDNLFPFISSNRAPPSSGRPLPRVVPQLKALLCSSSTDRHTPSPYPPSPRLLLLSHRCQSSV